VWPLADDALFAILAYRMNVASTARSHLISSSVGSSVPTSKTIQHPVMINVRFPLSLRNVESLLHVFGPVVVMFLGRVGALTLGSFLAKRTSRRTALHWARVWVKS
tara:strand:+ start:172 stop:489 length:318 start_codon:yes stop_codon:yes gene_type:complete